MQKKTYILYNTQLKRPLMHPKVGLWFTDDKKEADELLAGFHQYVKDIGHEEMVEHIVVREMIDYNYPTQ